MNRKSIALGLGLAATIIVAVYAWTRSPVGPRFSFSQARKTATQQSQATPGAQPRPVAAALGSPAKPITVADQVKILDEILKSRDDNDPRLDRELRYLSPRAREALRKKYHSLRAEERNERGTIVFLLGRNLDQPRDFAFFRDVVGEKPCLSLADCGHTIQEDPHLSGVTAVSLAYPQIVALKSLANLPPSERAQAQGILDRALRSPDPLVSGLASRIRASWKAGT
jgi:hypothetical protein